MGLKLISDVKYGLNLRRREFQKDKRKSYVPVEVICSCGEILVKTLDNPWSDNKELLRKFWEHHYCKE